MSGTNVFFDNRYFESQTFTSDGTFNVPAGVDMVWVEMYGGGGAGGISSDAAFGGESGERVCTHYPVTPLGSVSVTIGIGGVGVFGANNRQGASGTPTIFGTIKSRGGRGGGTLTGIFGYPLGAGIGRDSMRANGGTSGPAFATGEISGPASMGGDAGYGNGGNGAGYPTGTPAPTDGGLGAGGGGWGNLGGPSTNSSGGDGICIVYWKRTI